MTKELIILTLVIALIYLYYQNKQLQKPALNTYSAGSTKLFSFEEESAQEQIQQLQTDLQQAQILQSSNAEKITQQRNTIVGLETEIEELKEQRNETEEENEVSAQQKDELTTEVTQLKQNLVSAKQEIERLKETREAVPEDYENLETERDTAIREKQSL